MSLKWSILATGSSQTQTSSTASNVPLEQGSCVKLGDGEKASKHLIIALIINNMLQWYQHTDLVRSEWRFFIQHRASLKHCNSLKHIETKWWPRPKKRPVYHWPVPDKSGQFSNLNVIIHVWCEPIDRAQRQADVPMCFSYTLVSQPVHLFVDRSYDIPFLY